VEEDVGLSVGAAWIAGQDRSMWRTLRPSAGQAQQWVSEWVSDHTWLELFENVTGPVFWDTVYMLLDLIRYL